MVLSTTQRRSIAAKRGVVEVEYLAFVGSHKKADALKAKLAERGVSAERLAKLKAPAGLDLALTIDGNHRYNWRTGDRCSRTGPDHAPGVEAQSADVGARHSLPQVG